MNIVDGFQRFPRAFDEVFEIVAELKTENCQCGISCPIPTPRTWVGRDFSTSTIRLTNFATNPKKLR